MTETTYPYLRVMGTPYQMGVQHGKQERDRVHRFLDMILSGAVRGDTTRREVLGRTRAFLPLFERSVPRLLPEIRGLADGAGISFEEALLLQILGAIGNARAEGCTTFVISGKGTAHGRILIGQTSDMGPEQEEVGMVLHLVPEEGPRILMWTFGGHLGYHGMNSAGVAHFANALGGGPPRRPGLPHYPVKRKMLEQETVAQVLRVLDTHPVCSSGNYVVTGADGTIEDVELTPEGYAALGDAGEGFIVHSNHFLSSRFRSQETDAASTPSSFPRYERIRQLILAQYGQLTVEIMQRIMSDHENQPLSICRHPQVGDSGKTVACLIAEPEQGRFHVCRGNPCANDFATHEV